VLEAGPLYAFWRVITFPVRVVIRLGRFAASLVGLDE
jgi:hypothetical protein